MSGRKSERSTYTPGQYAATASGKTKQRTMPKPDEYDRVDDLQTDKPGVVACVKFATTPGKVAQWHKALEEYCNVSSVKGTTELYIDPGFKQGKQLKVLKGKFANVTVNVYNTGTIMIQGKANVGFAESEYPKLRSIANSLIQPPTIHENPEESQPTSGSPSVCPNVFGTSDSAQGVNHISGDVNHTPSDANHTPDDINHTPDDVNHTPDDAKVKNMKMEDDDITLEKEKFRSAQNLQSNQGVKEHPPMVSKIPVSVTSPMKVTSSAQSTLMLDILNRLENSQVAIQSELNQMSEQIGRINNSVTNIDNRLSKLEKFVKSDTQNCTDVAEIKEDVQSVERLINTVITSVNTVSQGVKDLPSIHDIGSMMPPRITLEEVSCDVKRIDSCLRNDVSDKLDIIAKNIDMVKKKSGMAGHSDVYNCKGEEDPFSNLWRCKVTYNDEEYDSAEHAIQVTRALHVFGGETDIIRRIKEIESPKQVKIFADKNIPFSPSWQKKKVKVQGDIFTAKFDQNQDIDERLKETGTAKIRHTVASKFWGTGRYGKGKNIFGKWLEARRAGKPLSSVQDQSDIESDLDEEVESDTEMAEQENDWSVAGRPIKFKPSTENVIIGDSLTDQINAEQFAKGTEKRTASTISDFENVVSRVVPNEKIKRTWVHVGINNIVDRQDNTISGTKEDRKQDANRLGDAMIELRSKLPNSQIFYSEAIDRDNCDEVMDFNYHVEVFKNRKQDAFEYITHSISSDFFRERDRKHLSESGNKIFIKPLKAKLFENGRGRSYQNQDHSSTKRGGRYSQSHGRRSPSSGPRDRSASNRGGRGRRH